MINLLIAKNRRKICGPLLSAIASMTKIERKDKYEK